ncbi:unnamed protein product [Auanema sp. JU1783]|nr:unnamed protein product [Auanema sp. JU1783]
MENGTDFEKAPATSDEGSKTVKMDYQSDFPSLPAARAPQAAATGAWNRPRPVAAANASLTLVLNSDERANKVKTLGNTTEEHKKCQHIASATGTKIELSESRDGTLTIVIKGLRGKIDEARSRLVKDLQTQANREIEIPKDHHGKIIGKDGATLKQLESDSNCKITIPNRDSDSSLIKIVGPTDGIEKAAAAIRAISDREAKLGHESIVCPKQLIPYVRGPFNENYDKLVSDYKVKINIPPKDAESEVITVTGEKDGVTKTAAFIRKVLEEKKNTVHINFNVSHTQHRYIRGPQHSGIHQILKETGVIVEIPAEEEEKDEIILRGDAAKLGDAIAMVLTRATSRISKAIDCPNWLHKHLIGPKGSTLATLVPNRTKVQVEFEGNSIYLEGAPEELNPAYETLFKEAARLQNELAIDKIKVHPTLHRHVIGKGGALISKIKVESEVQIHIPSGDTGSDEITIEGKKAGVKKAVQEIKAIVSKIENEKSKDIIIEQRFHKMIIGAKGSEVSKIRDQFPNVTLTFPETNKKSDIVNIRGDKNDVEKVHKILLNTVKELNENNYQQVVPIFKEFHKNIIGKGGATIRRIREETETRIDLPEGSSGEDKITVTGKQKNVEKAIEQLNKIQNELANIVNIELDIPVKVQSRLLGGGRRLVSDIETECGGVQIKFPSEKSESTKVTVRGPKDDAAKAEKLLAALAKDKEQDLLEETVTAKPEYHKFLIGKGGAKINKLRENYDVRVMFPRESDTDQETIHLLGKKECVLTVKKDLENAIKELNETVEIQVDIDSKHHKHFLVRGAAVLKEIQDQNGGVRISFPKEGNSVTVKGSKTCVESAKSRIEDIIEDIENQVTLKVEIPSQYHRALLSNRGQKIHDLQTKHRVQIRFPDRRKEGEVDENANPDVVTIAGRDVRCEEAKTDLLALVPIQRVINVPTDAHKMLIGRGGETVRKMMQDFDVNISIPKGENASEEIVLTGQVENVENALEDIREKMKQYDAEAEERKLKSFQLVVEAPAEYHQRIIGPKGSVINSLRDKHSVQISMPRGEEAGDSITIQGKEENARACATDIEAIIDDIRSMFTQEVQIDHRCHPRLIGSRGRNLKTMMEKYEVEIRFPRENAADADLVVVCGRLEDNVYDCIDYLRDEEEKWLEENQDREAFRVQRAPEPEQRRQPANVQISNAPWQMDMEQFPDMGVAAQAQPVGGAWGGNRRW